MDHDERPRKTIEGAGQSARKAPRPRGAARGELKGRPNAELPQSGPSKAPLNAARRAAKGAERIVSSGEDLPLQRDHSREERGGENRSLRLRLRVENGRVTVLDAHEVEAPGTLPEQARGTSFIEVRVGNEVVAANALVDPGVEIGTPDPRDTEEFRGHRVVESRSYETFIRVPLDVLNAVMTRGAQGLSENERRGAQPKLEIGIYKTKEHLIIEPRRSGPLAAAHRDKVERVASSGELTLEEIRGAGGSLRKPAQPDAGTNDR